MTEPWARFAAQPRFVGALVLDETRPEIPRSRKTPKALVLTRVPGTAGKTSDTLGAVIEHAAERWPFERLEVDYYSTLRALPRLDAFPQLRTLRVRTRSVRSWAGLGEPKTLEEIELWWYPEKDLRKLRRSPLRSARIGKGAVVTCDASSASMWFQSCRGLRALAKVDVERLTLTACHGFDLTTLERSPALRDLAILGRPRMSSFDFVDGLPHLEALEVIAVPGLDRADLGAIVRAPKLRSVLLGNARAAAALARAAPHLAVRG